MREPIHETLVEAALYIGHEMGSKHESMAGDSREFIDALCEKCYEFETEWQHLGEEGYYIDAVEVFAERTLIEFRTEGMVSQNAEPVPYENKYDLTQLDNLIKACEWVMECAEGHAITETLDAAVRAITLKGATE